MYYWDSFFLVKIFYDKGSKKMGKLADAIIANIVRDYSIIPNKVIFLDPVDGYAGGDGSYQIPIKTWSTAYGDSTTSKNDCIIFNGKSDTSKIELSTAFDYAKSATHLLGFCTDVLEGKRSRFTQLSTATGVTTLFTISGSNNVFANIRFFQGVTDATSLVAVKITGQRNKFKNCEFAGIGDATQSATGAASLKIDGGSENYFEDCVIGLDTIARDANATELLFDGGATRNYFKHCIIKSYISAAGFASVTINDTTAIDRPQIFEDCLFITDSENRGITQTQVFSIPSGIVQGKIVLKNCLRLTDGSTGAGVWDANSRATIWNSSPAAGSAGSGGVATKL
jgi:hypothetical protein